MFTAKQYLSQLYPVSLTLEFSVLIASHDRENMLNQALDSLERQTIDHNKFEVIVVKDYDIKGKIFENRSFSIRVFDSDITAFWKKHLIGVNNALGEYICLLDDDDLFSRFKLQKISEDIKANVNAGFIVNAKSFFNDGEDPVDMDYIKIKGHSTYNSKSTDCKDLFNKIPWYNCSSMTIKRSIAIEHIEKIEGTINDLDTFWFVFALEYCNYILYDDNELTLYRRHKLGVSRSNDLAKLCNYSEKAIINLTRMKNLFSTKNASRLISYNTCEWNAKARALGCVRSRKLIVNSIFSLIPFIHEFSKKWIMALLALLVISFISVKIAQIVYPKIYQ